MRARVRHLNPVTMGFQIAMDARFLSAANGASLAAWPSRPGTSIGATASGTAQPTFLERSINGLPAVQFDGSTDCMDFDSGALALPNSATGLLALVVGVSDNAALDSNQLAIFFSSGTSASAARFLFGMVSGNISRLNTGGRRLDADTLVGTGTVTGTATPCVMQCMAEWSLGSVNGRLNGGNPVSTSYSSGAGNCSPTNSLAARLGGQSVTQQRLAGRISAVYISTPILSQPLRMRARQHLGFTFRIPTA